MIALSVNFDGDGALAGLDIEEASQIEALILDGGTSSGRPSVTLHLTVGDRHIVAQTSARLFCTVAKMIEAKYPKLFDD